MGLLLSVDVGSTDDPHETMREWAEAAGPTSLRVVVVAYSASDDLHAPFTAPPGFVAASPRVASSWVAAIEIGRRALECRVVAVVDSSVRVAIDTLEELAGFVSNTTATPRVVENDAPGVSVACPVVTRSNGTVASAGAVRVRSAFPPAALWAGHPIEDAARAGVVEVFAADTPVFVTHAALLRPTIETRDLPLGAAHLTRSIAVADSGRVLSVSTGRVSVTSELVRSADEGALRIIRDFDRLPVDDLADRALAAAGLERAGLSSPDPVGSRLMRVPVIRARRRGQRMDVVVEHPASLRWAIKTAVHPGPEGDTWGDTFFASDLARALSARGQQVVVDNRESQVRPASDHLDEVTLVLRGLDRIATNPASLNLLWVISHPDLVDAAELAGYDLRFAASIDWAARTGTSTGLAIAPLLQATDPERFAPGDVDAELASDVLFVGSTRGVFRGVVRDALAAGLDLGLWGEGWDGLVPDAVIRGRHLANSRLPAAYRSARIVLNDQWGDMAREGFFSNRLFDAAAAGAVVLTPALPGLSDVFGPLVTTYSSRHEMALAARAIPSESADTEAAHDAARRFGAENSFDRRAEQLIESVAALRDRNQR